MKFRITNEVVVHGPHRVDPKNVNGVLRTGGGVESWTMGQTKVEILEVFTFTKEFPRGSSLTMLEPHDDSAASLIGRGVSLVISEPYEFEAHGGGSRLAGVIRGILEDQYQKVCLLVRLREEIRWEGIQSEYLIASPRHTGSTIADLSRTGSLIANLDVVPKSVSAKFVGKEGPRAVQSFPALTEDGRGPIFFVGMVSLEETKTD